MSSPRFIVGSLSGMPISAGAPARGGTGGQNRPMPTLWYVWDSAYCYRIMLETWKRWQAERLADRLNRKYG